MPTDPLFDFYAGGIKNKFVTAKMTLVLIHDRLRSDFYDHATHRIRSQADKTKRDEAKRELNYATFSGEFAPYRLADNLTAHSGYICVDFDHVQNLFETRLQLQADPYTRLLFVSPSGDGLKLVVAAPSLACQAELPEGGWVEKHKTLLSTIDEHKALFADMSAYYQQTYGLIPDASGSDVSRACFLPSCHDAFLNPASEDYQAKGLVQKKVRPRSEQQQVIDASDTYKHVAVVVERLEAAGANITGDDYNTWYILAFCMATLGEPGRELLHRISQLSSKYDPGKTDSKFDEAIKTTRFNTPWKFFSLAKESGIDIGKPKREKPSAASTDTPSQPAGVQPSKADRAEKSGFETNDIVFYDLDFYQISVRAGRRSSTIADNFLLYIKYLTEDENENLTWIMEIQALDADPIYVEVPHEEFNSAAKLKRILSGKQFALKISDGELGELHAFLFSHTRFSRAIKIIRYGFHSPSGVFFFANKALAPGGTLLLPDEFGMVQSQAAEKTLHLSLPRNNKQKAHRFQLTDTQISLNAYFDIYQRAHTYEIALLAFCFYISSCFRDISIQHSNTSPILYLKGPGGSGKSSVVRHLTAAFGRKQEGINLKGRTTASALVKLASQGSNCFVWFDEFNNELDRDVLGLIQAMYDNDGYHLSKMSALGTNETDSIDIYSSLALTSNYIPDDAILFSRFVFIPVLVKDKTAEQAQAFRILEDLTDQGVGCLTVEVLQHRGLVESQYTPAYELIQGKLREAFSGEKMPERLITSMSKLLTIPFILASTGKIQITETSGAVDVLADLIAAGVQQIRRQNRIMEDKTPLSEFFEIIQQLYDQYQIHEELHFLIIPIGGDLKIRLWFAQLYNLYAAQYRRINMRAPADRHQLESEMAAFEELPDYEAMKKTIRFANDGESRSNEKTMPRSNSCEMSYSRLRDKFGLQLDARRARTV